MGNSSSKPQRKNYKAIAEKLKELCDDIHEELSEFRDQNEPGGSRPSDSDSDDERESLKEARKLPEELTEFAKQFEVAGIGGSDLHPAIINSGAATLIDGEKALESLKLLNRSKTKKHVADLRALWK